MRMWQLVHRHRGSSRSFVAEKLSVYIVVPREIVHVYKISRHLDDIFELRIDTVKYVANVFEDGLSLRSNIEMSRSKLVHLSPGDRVIGATRARARYKKKIPRALEVRILASRLRL